MERKTDQQPCHRLFLIFRETVSLSKRRASARRDARKFNVTVRVPATEIPAWSGIPATSRRLPVAAKEARDAVSQLAGFLKDSSNLQPESE